VRAAAPQRRHHSCSFPSGEPHSGHPSTGCTGVSTCCAGPPGATVVLTPGLPGVGRPGARSAWAAR
jgi:hypothetical protein